MVRVRSNEIASAGEVMVREGLIAARVLSILDNGQSHYGNIVHARVTYDPNTDPAGKLELAIASAESQYSPPEVEAAMAQANQQDRAALADLHANQKIPRQQQIKAALESIITDVAAGKLGDNAGYREIVRRNEALKKVAIVNVSIDYAAVRADLARLMQEAQQLNDQGELAAAPVVEYLNEALQSAPRAGIERGVRDYFFFHTMLNGSSWGYIMAGSGLLLVDCERPQEAVNDLTLANRLGYDTPALRIGLGKAHEQLGNTDEALRNFYAVVKEAPMDADATEALARLHRQKASQIRRKVQPLNIPAVDLERAMQESDADRVLSVLASTAGSRQEKASELYILGVAHLSREDGSPETGLELLQESYTLDPNRNETHMWLAEAFGRTAAIYEGPRLLRPTFLQRAAVSAIRTLVAARR